MHILLVNNTRLPVKAYGGAERITWWLGKALVKMGHDVTFLVKKNSRCDFANVKEIDETLPYSAQIPASCDIVHFHIPNTEDQIDKPCIYTYHTNSEKPQTFHPNTVFLSKDHAKRHGGTVFVYNGLDFDDYGDPILTNKRMYLHFLGKADWRVKNVKGAIEIAGKVGERLHVIGGTRVNFGKNVRITFSPHVRFHGMLGGDGKNVLLNGSKGLLYPTLWHEPFGLALIESLWFGCPVFGTPFGALTEIVGGVHRSELDRPRGNGVIDAIYSDFGCLSEKKAEIIEAVKDADSFKRQVCHDYVRSYFSADRMAKDYIALYEKILSGYGLHDIPPICLEPQQGKLLSMR
jgi:glycosyltransferase involved in cell wall biosynthesis